MENLKASYTIQLINTIGDIVISKFAGCHYCGEHEKLQWAVKLASNKPAELHWLCPKCGHSGYMIGFKEQLFEQICETGSNSDNKKLIKAIKLISRIDKILSGQSSIDK